MAEEEWKPISVIPSLQDYTNFEMNRRGDLRNTRGYILKGCLNHGYTQFCISQNGKQKTIIKHRILAALFLENPMNYPLVEFIDKNPLNCCLENLKWSCGYGRNSTGHGHVQETFVNGRPVWLVEFGDSRKGNRSRSILPRNPKHTLVPDNVLKQRDFLFQYWKANSEKMI